MQKYDVVWTYIQYSDSKGGKVRPAVILGNNKILPLSSVAPVTSHEPRKGYFGEVALQDWEEAGLNNPSTVRLSKITEKEIRPTDRKAGHLSNRDIKTIEKYLGKNSKLNEDIIPYYYKYNGILVAGYDFKTGASIVPSDWCDDWDEWESEDE